MTSSVAARYGITLTDNGSPVGLALDSLVRPALRRNPRRAQLLVSTVLGKHIPVDPRVAAGVGRLLGALVDRRLRDDSGPLPALWSSAASDSVTGDRPGALLQVSKEQSSNEVSMRDHGEVLVLGFAETATSLGHLVADQLGSGYLHSTRRRSGGVPIAAEFTESHSHATGHLLRPASPDLLASADTVVFVDDELSTGRTALNVLEVLHAIRPRRRYVLAGLVDVRSDEADAERAAAAERLGCPIDVVSLVRGTVTVPADAAQRVAADFGPGHRSSEMAGGSSGVDTGDFDPSGPSSTAPGSPLMITVPEGAGPDTAVPDTAVPDTAVPNPAVPDDAVPDDAVLSIRWPGTVPMGGAHGFLPADRARFAAAVDEVADRLGAELGEARRVLVVGTEEFMYLPLRVALALAERAGTAVAFQSTTRSPVHVLDQADYPIRRRIDFRAFVDGGPDTERRFLYNASWPTGPNTEPDLVLVVDDGSVLPGPAGLVAAVAVATGARVVLAAIGTDTPP